MLKFSEIQKLLQTVDFYHTYFAATNLDQKVLTEKDIEILKKGGVNPAKLPKNHLTRYAYQFGVLAAVMKEDKLKTLDFNNLKKLVETADYVPLTAIQEESLLFAQQHVYNDLKAQGNQVAKDLTREFETTSTIYKDHLEKVTKEELDKWLDEGDLFSSLDERIEERMKNWKYRFEMISEYAIQSLFQRGVADHLQELYGVDVKVYFIVHPDACVNCKNIFLEKGGKPRIFKLSTILANGSNIGRKVKEWLATIDPIHPHCRCTMMKLPYRAIWNPAINRYETSKKSSYIRKKSKKK